MSFKEEIEAWMNQTKIDLISEYDRQGLRASGKYANSLEPIVKERAGGYNLQMLGARHSEFMQNGREPNKIKSPEQAKRLYPIIKEWVSDKGLNFDNGHIFAICLKIVYEGIKVPNKYNPGGVVSNVVTDVRINNLIKKIGGKMVSDFKSDVIKQLKTA